MIVKFVVFILMIKFGFRLLNSEIGNDRNPMEQEFVEISKFSSP